MADFTGEQEIKLTWSLESGVITVDLKDIADVSILSLVIEQNKFDALATALGHIAKETKSLSPLFRGSRVDYGVNEGTGVIKLRDTP